MSEAELYEGYESARLRVIELLDEKILLLATQKKLTTVLMHLVEECNYAKQLLKEISDETSGNNS
jgi:hypothetical protein